MPRLIMMEHELFLSIFFDVTQNFCEITKVLHKRKHCSKKGKDKADKKVTMVEQNCW